MDPKLQRAARLSLSDPSQASLAVFQDVSAGLKMEGAQDCERERIHATFPVQRHWDIIGKIEAQAAQWHLGISYCCKDAHDFKFSTIRMLIRSSGVGSYGDVTFPSIASPIT